MSPMRVTVVFAALVCGAARAGNSVEIVRAGFWGTAENDDIQSATAAPDGTVYIVGNTGVPAKDLPGGVAPKVLGAAAAEPKCGCGFVAHFSADMSKLLQYAEFAPGVAFLTTVRANTQGVYVSGYASEALEPLLDGKGLIAKYPLAEQVKLVQDGKIAAANGIPDNKDPIAGRPHLGRYGAPCVMLFSADLQTFSAGTYLEGWQQVWDKFRVKQIKPREMHPVEYFWQPTLLAPLNSGDLVVLHDGGYFNILTDKDRELAGSDAELLKRLGFYNCCDHLSRLSPDLKKRVWTKAIYTPAVEQNTVKRLKKWPYPYYSSPRTHRMRLDRDENIHFCGFSTSQTINEPYWSPYVWKMAAADGRLLAKFYEYDTFSGPDNRMLGTVADTAISAIAIDDDNNLLAGLFADGGNTVMGWSPKAELGKRFEQPIKGNAGVKLVHWWGMVHRVNAQTREGLGGVRLCSTGGGPCWVVDIQSLSKNYVLTVGRFNNDLQWTPDAWQKGEPTENPAAFVRVFTPDFETQFSSAVRGIVPYELVRVSERRFLLVGQALLDTPPVKDALFDTPRGKTDGYLLLLEFSEAHPAFAK